MNSKIAFAALSLAIVLNGSAAFAGGKKAACRSAHQPDLACERRARRRRAELVRYRPELQWLVEVARPARRAQGLSEVH